VSLVYGLTRIGPNWGNPISLIRNRALISKGKRNINENIITNQALKKEEFLGEQLIVSEEINCKCWIYGEVGHYTNECKNRKNNKLIETLGSLDFVELSEDEALVLTLSNNNRIVEIILDNEYEKNDYKETSHMIENSPISLGECT